MMEFFLSKFWAFLVAMLVMAVLVQGIDMDARADRNEALNDLADELEKLFNDLATAGPGLGTTIDLGQVLPSKAVLTLFNGYASLEDTGQVVRFAIPSLKMNIESDGNGWLEVQSLVLRWNDRILFKNQAEGSTITVLNR